MKRYLCKVSKKAFRIHSVYLTHSQTEVPSLRGSNITAHLGRLHQNSRLCDVKVGARVSIENKKWHEAVGETWCGEAHCHQEQDSHPGCHHNLSMTTGWSSQRKPGLFLLAQEYKFRDCELLFNCVCRNPCRPAVHNLYQQLLWTVNITPSLKDH